MTAQEEAVVRYHKLLDSPAYRDLGWAKSIQEKMTAHNLVPGGRPVCPVLRPHLLTRRQYESISKSAETLYAAIDRLRTMVLTTPALLNRMEMLPGEKMLAGVDPGYPQLAVTSSLETMVHNGTLRFVEANVTAPSTAVYSDALGEVFFDAPPVKELRKRHKLSRVNSMKRLLGSILAAYKVTGKKKFPRIAIVEFRPPFKSGASPESLLLAEHLRRSGYPTEVIAPELLEYRNGVLCRGDFGIEIVYRKVSAQEFLVRFDLSHPLLRAYREGAVCVINSFRTEMVQKKSLFSLLTDETVTGKFPAAERKAIRESIPWTRTVAAGPTTHDGKTVDLLEYIARNRERLVLKPNDPTTDQHSFQGWEMEDAAWERAVKTATRSPYVVQERVKPIRAAFPVYQFGSVSMKEMEVDVRPHIYLGRVEGCTTEVSDATSKFSTLAGIAPTFILES